MVSPSLVAAIGCLVPAMAGMWVFLRRYEGLFDERRMFFALMAGLFAGLLVFFLEYQVFRFEDLSRNPALLLYAATYYIVGYTLVEALAKGAVLGLKRFRTRKDTPYYGVSLGLAFGAVVAMQGMNVQLVQGGVMGYPLGQMAWTVLVLLVLWVGVILTHGATAVWVGRGSAQGKLWTGIGIAMLLQAPVLVLRFFTAEGAVSVWGALLVLGYGVLVSSWTQRKVLETIIPPEILMQVGRAKRRQQRRGN